MPAGMYPGSRSRVKPLHLQQQLADEQDGVPPDERVRVLQAGGHGGNVPVHHRRVPCLCALDDWRYIGSRRGRCVALRVRVRVRVRKGREGKGEGKGYFRAFSVRTRYVTLLAGCIVAPSSKKRTAAESQTTYLP